MMSSKREYPKGDMSDQDRNEAIDRLYDVALDPERYETLLDVWESAVSPLRAKADFTAPRLLDDPMIAGHFQRAGEFLDRVDLTQPTDEMQDILAPFGKVSAFVLDDKLVVKAVNSAATERLSLNQNSKLADLAVNVEDIKAIGGTVRSLLANTAQDTAVLRVRSLEKGHFVVLRLQRCQAAGGVPLVLAALSEVGWPQGFNDILRRAFSLTGAEADVVQSLVECCSVKDIAALRGRSIDTVRAQVKSILSKTETRSQVELVRLALSVMDMANLTLDTHVEPRLVSKGYATLKPHDYQSLTTPDGRRLDYLVLGNPKGAPILFLPLDYGLVRWPASAEAEAAKRNWRIIVPVRAGFGRSDSLPKQANLDDALIDDTMQFLKAEKVKRCPILSLGSDSFYGVQLAKLYPDTFTALIACAGVLPMTRREQFERMEKWHRFILAGAKYTPHLLPFMVKAGFLLARKIGKRGFIHAVYGSSPADVDTFEDPEVFEAMVTGSEVALSETHSAHDSFSRMLLGPQNGDWSADVDALKGQLPVIFVNGMHDPQVPSETLADFKRDHVWIDYRIYEDAGQLIFFRHWQDVLEILEPFLKR
ncbi:MAG: DNA-binding CsgD family transcriptional regulator/pimeloyl-ACP methyl ester carboxylesterase [Candidatus Azotimanducaceae bacterium]|jgi:DNA-binding CsgD family transcriptional regulator/pimeloyl-ACP methyl ester carboxylesterase